MMKNTRTSFHKIHNVPLSFFRLAIRDGIGKLIGELFFVTQKIRLHELHHAVI